MLSRASKKDKIVSDQFCYITLTAEVLENVERESLPQGGLDDRLLVLGFGEKPSDVRKFVKLSKMMILAFLRKSSKILGNF